MNSKINKAKVISSLFWKLMERGGTQGIQFIVQILLARLILPNDYGIIALIVIFINIANVFVQSGFSTALIQKKDADEIDFSSVFFLNLFVSTFFYVILYLTAPIIANFYGELQIIPILRVLSISLFFGAINSVQNAVVSRGMDFKKLFFSSLGAIIISGIVGITLAYEGFGVWALVAQQLANQIIVAIILWFTVKWRPKLIFSFIRVRILFSYGWKLLMAALIETCYANLCSLVIGKINSPQILAFYSRGEQFPKIIVDNVDGSIQSVMLPTLSSYQDNKQRVKAVMRRSIITSSFIIFPLMVGLAITAENIVKILLTDKWLPCVPFLQIFCAAYALWPIHTANLQAINALGRSDIFLRLEVIKKILGLIILGISINFGVYAIAVGILISGIIATFINAYPNLKLINYSYKEQCKDVMPSLIVSLVMGLTVYNLKWFNMPSVLVVILQSVVGIFIYIAMAKILKLECYIYLITTFKDILKGQKGVAK